MTAALAGARHVYAVEATVISRAAQRLVEANGVGDRVTIIGGHSLDIDLPERATVLVSEIIGDDPLRERILPTFADARERLLVEGARIIPNRLRICALPLEVPAERLEALRFTTSRAAVWKDRYALDFESLVTMSGEQAHRAYVNSQDTRTWTRLSEPVVLADLDLLSAPAQPIERELRLRMTMDGSVSGILVYFEAQLGGGGRIALHPDATSRANSWGNLLYVLPSAISVSAGEERVLRYRYDDDGSSFELG